MIVYRYIEYITKYNSFWLPRSTYILTLRRRLATWIYCVELKLNDV